MPHVALVPFTGVRVREAEMLVLGMKLPGLQQRGAALAELPALGLLTLAGLNPDNWSASYHPTAAAGNAPEPAWRFAVTMLAGGLLGFLVTMTSIGAGALGVVMLVALYPLRLTPARLVATDLAHAIPLAMIAGGGHLLLGHVDFSLLGQLLLGSIPGVWLGAHFGGRLPDRVLRVTIAVVLALVGIRLLA